MLDSFFAGHVSKQEMPGTVSILPNRLDVALEVRVNAEFSTHRLRNDMMSIVDNVTLALVSEPISSHVTLLEGQNP
jgi:hypothetical protein